jgi:hypothetical protein
LRLDFSFVYTRQRAKYILCSGATLEEAADEKAQQKQESAENDSNGAARAASKAEQSRHQGKKSCSILYMRR